MKHSGDKNEYQTAQNMQAVNTDAADFFCRLLRERYKQRYREYEKHESGHAIRGGGRGKKVILKGSTA